MPRNLLEDPAMRLRSLACFIVMIGAALPAAAQGPAESASNEMINDALRQTDCRFTRDGDAFVVEMNNRTFWLHRLDNGARLLAKAPVKKEVSLTALNRYNEKHAITTRAIHAGKQGVILEAGIDCSLGVNEAGLKKFIARFVKEAGAFETFLAGVQDADPPVVAKMAEKQKPPINIKPNSDDQEFTITFPTHEKENWETAWKIVWDIENGKQANDQGFTKMVKGKEVPQFSPTRGPIFFKIKKAYFKPGQKADWIQVLEDAHPQEFYVPYYFRGTRFYDLRDVGGYTTLNAREGGAVSQLMGKSKRVMAELRDTGVVYKFGERTRRGEELTLWANFQAGNYTYMIEYGFKDDGGIVFRHSPTGYNYFGTMDAAHMHGSYWRIGMKLGPDGNNDRNQVFVTRLPIDPKAQGDGGKLDVQEVTKESFHDWDAEAFTRIRVSNPNYSIVPAGKDRPALPISYDLVTVQQGVARHRRNADEKFSLHDFWITRHDCPQKMYVYLDNYFFSKGEPNPNLKPLNQENVVIWHSSSGLHVPRAEDGISGGNSSPNNGQAIVYWTTFELRPRNLFLTTPIYRSKP
jgi:hypothetical protein